MGGKNKEGQLINLIREHKPDIFLLQEAYLSHDRESKSLLFNLGLKKGRFTYRGTHSGGVATLITSDKYKIGNNETDNRGRTCLTTVTDGREQRHLIVNTYAPRKRYKTQGTYFQETYTNIQRVNTKQDEVIWDGGFYAEEDDRDKDTKELNKAAEAFKLKLARNSSDDNNVNNTFKPNNQKIKNRILDKLYIPERFTQYQIKHIDTEDYSDHLAVMLKLEDVDHRRRKKSSHWKFNNSLLANQELPRKIKDIIKEIKGSKRPKGTRREWEQLKDRIKELTIDTGQKEGRRRKKKKEIRSGAKSMATDPAKREAIEPGLKE